ncbi:MAG TPA: acetyl-CoA C-acyltransferase [Symbiobacteriaceae bacterium]|jgi:acetyl-CoA acyltransferase|nr:acetyl-CoA C-acyltransferase [Symbiobacteriaceae bacterium]
MREAVIVSGARLAQGKAPKGTLRHMRPEDMAATVIREAIRRVPNLHGEMVEDVVMGCAFPEGEQGLNFGRIAAVRAGLPNSVPGFTINRFCSSGLNAIAIAAQFIQAGSADIVVAGGTESMSRVPMGGHTPRPHPEIVATYPELYISMGHTAENVCARYEISREECDAFALRSHQRAAAAIDAGKFKDEIVPVTVRETGFDGKKAYAREILHDTDECVRRETTMEALAKLKPAFAAKGNVTAGNSSPITDGAAAVVVMSADKAEEIGVRPLAIFRSFAVGGVDPDVMGIGPVAAVPKALKIAGLRLEDMDLIELNEAFASQSLAVCRTLGFDMEKVNVNGGAIALGHPLGCSGARLTVSIMHEAKRRNAKYGLVTMCVGGGMGAAGVLEFIN